MGSSPGAQPRGRQSIWAEGQSGQTLETLCSLVVEGHMLGAPRTYEAQGWRLTFNLRTCCRFFLLLLGQG